MTRYQKPGPKRGKKKVAPKKAHRSKPIPQQVAEKAAIARGREQVREASDRIDKSLAACEAAVKEQQKRAGDMARVGRDYMDHVLRPTVEEQFDASDSYRYAGNLTCHTATPPFSDDDLPAPKPPGPRSKFWRQYQNEFGKFIGWPAAMKLTKDKVISRLVLRKPKRSD